MIKERKLEFNDYEYSNGLFKFYFMYNLDENEITEFIKSYCPQRQELLYESIDHVEIEVVISDSSNFSIYALFIKDNGNVEDVPIKISKNNVTDFVDVVYRNDSTLAQEAYRTFIGAFGK